MSENGEFGLVSALCGHRSVGKVDSQERGGKVQPERGARREPKAQLLAAPLTV